MGSYAQADLHVVVGTKGAAAIYLGRPKGGGAGQLRWPVGGGRDDMPGWICLLAPGLKMDKDMIVHSTLHAAGVMRTRSPPKKKKRILLMICKGAEICSRADKDHLRRLPLQPKRIQLHRNPSF